jgi:glucan biosynthesis protein C
MRRMTISTGATSRLHHFDALRSALMLLILPYHAARVHVPGGDNFIASTEVSLALDGLTEFLRSFHMPAFFVLAGYFSWKGLTRKGPGNWGRGRLIRLGVPLIFSTLVLAPIMTSAVATFTVRAGEAPSFAAAIAGEMGRSRGWVYHLWFLHSLLMMSAVLLLAATPAATRLSAPAERLAQRIGRTGAIAGGLLLALPCLATAIGLSVLSGRLGIALQPFGSVFNIAKMLLFLPFFLTGAAMARFQSVADWFERQSAAALPVAIAASLLYALLTIRLVELPSGELRSLVRMAATAVASIFWVKTLVPLFAKHLGDEKPGVRYLSDASYGVFLLHLPILLWLAVLLQPVALGAWVEFTLLTVLGFSLSFLAWEAVRRWPRLRFLLTGD